VVREVLQCIAIVRQLVPRSGTKFAVAGDKCLVERRQNLAAKPMP